MTLNGFNTIDLIIGSLILVLGLKGLFNGFRKETFGFVGLIGGVFIASRAAKPLASIAESRVLHLSNPAVWELISFVIVLLLTWGVVALIGNAVENRIRTFSLSITNRLLGFVIAALKYFLVLSMILAALYRTPLIRDTFGKSADKSLLFPYLDRAGSLLINLTPIAGTSKTTADTSSGR